MKLSLLFLLASVSFPIWPGHCCLDPWKETRPVYLWFLKFLLLLQIQFHGCLVLTVALVPWLIVFVTWSGGNLLLSSLFTRQGRRTTEEGAELASDTFQLTTQLGSNLLLTISVLSCIWQQGWAWSGWCLIACQCWLINSEWDPLYYYLGIELFWRYKHRRLVQGTKMHLKYHYWMMSLWGPFTILFVVLIRSLDVMGMFLGLINFYYIFRFVQIQISKAFKSRHKIILI